MKKWATSLVLILVMGGSVLAGLPVHFGGHDCGHMDCCETEKASRPSHSHGVAPTEQAANLYCFLNCPEPTLPSQTGAEGKASPSASADIHPVAIQPPLAVPLALLRRLRTEPNRPDSHPIYIRHLALLI